MTRSSKLAPFCRTSEAPAARAAEHPAGAARPAAGSAAVEAAIAAAAANVYRQLLTGFHGYRCAHQAAACRPGRRSRKKVPRTHRSRPLR